MTYKQFYKYRSVWIGISILCITLFHARYTFNSKTLSFLKELTYGGLDILLFASGLGCTFSYRKTNNLFLFLKRRFLRIFPTYLLFMLIWIPCYVIIKKIPFPSVIGNILGIEYFADPDHSFNWYISFILLMYMFTPFLIELVKASKAHHFTLILFFLLLFSLPFLRIHDSIVMASRIPVFTTGIFFAIHFDPEEKISRKIAVGMIAAMIIGTAMVIYLFKNFQDNLYYYGWQHGLFWYPFILIAPGFCFLVSWICDFLTRKRLPIISKLFIWGLSAVGNLSFELYLVQVLVLLLYYDYSAIQNNFILSALLVVIFVGAIILKKATETVCKRFIHTS